MSGTRRWQVLVVATLAALSLCLPGVRADTEDIVPPYTFAEERAYCGLPGNDCTQSARADAVVGTMQTSAFIEANPPLTKLRRGTAKGSIATASLTAAHELAVSAPEVVYDLHFQVDSAAVDATGFTDARAYIQADVYQPESGAHGERPTWQIFDGGEGAPPVSMDGDEVVVQLRLPNAAPGEVRIVVYVTSNAVLRQGPLLKYLGPGRAAAHLDVVWTHTTATY